MSQDSPVNPVFGTIQGLQYGNYITSTDHSPELVDKAIAVLREDAVQVLAKHQTVRHVIYFTGMLDGKHIVGWRTGDDADLNVVLSETV